MGKTENACLKSLAACLTILLPPVLPEVTEWIEDAIDLDAVPNCAADGKVKLRAWQKDIIRAQFDPRYSRVIISAIEQIGKSVCWQWPLLYRMLHQPSAELVVFESDDKANGINLDAILPLVMSNPELAGMLGRYDAQKAGYRFSNGGVVDFQGAGAQNITSRPYRIAILDEIDRYGSCSHAAALSQLRDAEKRLRSYKDQSKMIVCCSPKNNSGGKSLVWELFQESNQQYWTLRCKECRKLTMRSSRIYHLQIGKTPEGEYDYSDLHLVCPACGHKHVEADAKWCSENGGYVSQKPENKGTAGFQIGILAVPELFTWDYVARAQTKAGSTSDLATQEWFDNSIRGISWKPRSGNSSTVIQQRKRDYTGVKLEHVMMSIDTQGDRLYYIVRGFDAAMNSYLLNNGAAMDWGELDRAWMKEYEGKRCIAGMIDHGGHRSKEVAEFVRSKANFFAYKGNSAIGVNWKLSTECARLYLVNPKPYQRKLIYLLYDKPAAKDYAWYLPQIVDEEYIEQMRGWKPPKLEKDKQDYDKWTTNSKDHYFDCEKMWIALHEIVIKRLGGNLISSTVTASPEALKAQEEALRRSQERRRALRRENEI